jgi:integrase
VAFIQKRCAECQGVISSSGRACPKCGSNSARWRARYRTPAGDERSRTFDRRGDAQAWLTGGEGAKLRGDWVDPALGRIAFTDWADRWLELQVDHKPKTRAGVEAILRKHLRPAFGSWPLAEILPEDVEQFKAELVASKMAPGTVRNIYWTLSGIMRSAVRNRRIASSPCLDVGLPRPRRREMCPLTAEEVAQLADAAGLWGDLVYFAAYTGMRFGEIAGLRVGRVRFGVVDVVESVSEANGEVLFVTPKNGRTRTVRLPAFVLELIAPRLAGRKPEELVFAGPADGPLRHGAFYRGVFVPAVKAAGLPEKVRFHDLRHTAAALLIAQGAHPRAIMERLGHSTIAVTMDVYGHLLPSIDEALTDGLDATFQKAHAAWMRPENGQVVELSR